MYTTPSGFQDILPTDWSYWNFVLSHIEEVTRLFGYRRVETPTLGPTEMFARTTGSGTDIVDKEMYTFEDRGGDSLTLRPEGTAPVMRAYLQHGMHKLPQPVKLYYVERIYRAERPQRGRLREHHQFGCEAIGLRDAYLDVEVISVLHVLYGRIGLRNLTLELNSIGDATCRPGYIQALVSYLQANESLLCPTCRERMVRNPLRVLDCKERGCQPVLGGAPHMLDYLCSPCRNHWNKVCHGLGVLDIAFQIDHRLVRGLDYYTDTVFEFRPEADTQQSVVGAGGRYDALSAAMEGPLVPGVGFGSGIERLILQLRETGTELPSPPVPTAYVAHAGVGTEDAALRLAHRLRSRGIAADMAFGDRSLKAQMKHANGMKARFAAIIGEDEMQNGLVTLRALDTGGQEQVAFDDVEEHVGSEGT